jgi:hypothetical protein
LAAFCASGHGSGVPSWLVNVKPCSSVDAGEKVLTAIPYCG